MTLTPEREAEIFKTLQTFGFDLIAADLRAEIDRLREENENLIEERENAISEARAALEGQIRLERAIRDALDHLALNGWGQSRIAKKLRAADDNPTQMDDGVFV